MRVHQILSVKGNTLFTTTPNARLSEAVKTMAEQDIGSLVVLDQGTLVGMLTFREVVHILAKRQAENRSGPTPPVSEIFVSEVYKSNPHIASPDMNVNDLRTVMLESRQRYLPVVEENSLIGVISFHDVAKAVLDEQGFENKMLKEYIGDWPAAEQSV